MRIGGFKTEVGINNRAKRPLRALMK